MGHPLLDLTNKTAVVIGGTSGIGLALARGLAQAGANVVPTGRRAELVRKSAAEMEALGRRSLVETCDVTDNSSIERLQQALGRIRQRSNPCQLRRSHQENAHTRLPRVRLGRHL